MIKLLRQGLSDFPLESIKAIGLYGREVGQITPAWCEEIAFSIKTVG